MTRWLRTPNGTMRLLPMQAAALVELMEYRRLSCIADVGSGKSICAALAPVVVDAKRPLIVVYARLLYKTQVEFRALAEHWRIPFERYTFRSYESLVERKRGSEDYADLLDRLLPDIIVCDEVHALKRSVSARTRRIRRHQKKHPNCIVVGLTGTPGDKQLSSVALLQEISLGQASPYPTKYLDLKEWGDALDAQSLKRKPLGALTQFSNGEDDLDTVRTAIGARASRVPGNVWLRTGSVQCSLYLDTHIVKATTVDSEELFNRARNTDEMPDGRVFEDSLYRSLVTKQMALGFSKLLTPAPPQKWRDARTNWYALCRDCFDKSSLGVESPFQVENLVRSRRLEDYGILAKWHEVKDTFKPQHVTVWHDDTMLQYAAAWLEEHKGLVWTQFPEVGIKLSASTKIPFFHNKGLSACGKNIETWPAGRGAILALEPNKLGRNLQRFSKNLFLTIPSSSDDINQSVGRTHRQGQEAESVDVTFLLACRENWDALTKAVTRARFDATLNAAQANKLLITSIEMPSESEVNQYSTARWPYGRRKTE